MSEQHKIIILGATGFVGKALTERWIRANHQVICVGRSKEKIKKLFLNKVEALDWDAFKASKIDLSGLTCVVNLAGAGIADKRWTSKRKTEILSSRVNATNHAVRFCLKHKVPLINASAIGIYGLQEVNKNGLPSKLDEDSVTFSVDSQSDFLLEVCQAWEEGTRPLKKAGIRSVNIRLGVILGRKGGALAKMALPFYLFAGGPIGSGYQPVSWISLTDVCRAIDFVIESKKLEGAVNLVAPHCVTQKELGNVLGKVLNRPSFMPTPGFILKLILGQMADELLLNGQHVYPKKLVDEGFTFNHPMIIDALKDIYE
ncbi:MAG: hypothetical protein ACI9E5_000898 [Candidatus Omnitrophota bacterium]|jgi:uncharacterized protein (TIGR01777 family)